MSQESSIWQGSPSQKNNFLIYLLSIIAFIVALYMVFFGSNIIGLQTRMGKYIALGMLFTPLGTFLYYWLTTEFTSYELTHEILYVRSGVLNKQIDPLELYRIRDYHIANPFFLSLVSFGKLGNIELVCSDHSHPVVYLLGIKNCEHLMRILRTNVEACRTEKNVREVEFK